MISYYIITLISISFSIKSHVYRMASESRGNIVSRDPGWRYCTLVEGNKNGTICNYHGLMIKNGGITRFKFHLSHIDPYSNTKKCPNVLLEVKQDMKQLLEQKSKAKAKKSYGYGRNSSRITKHNGRNTSNYY